MLFVNVRDHFFSHWFNAKWTNRHCCIQLEIYFQIKKRRRKNTTEQRCGPETKSDFLMNNVRLDVIRKKLNLLLIKALDACWNAIMKIISTKCAINFLSMITSTIWSHTHLSWFRFRFSSKQFLIVVVTISDPLFFSCSIEILLPKQALWSALHFFYRYNDRTD